MEISLLRIVPTYQGRRELSVLQTAAIHHKQDDCLALKIIIIFLAFLYIMKNLVIHSSCLHTIYSRLFIDDLSNYSSIVRISYSMEMDDCIVTDITIKIKAAEPEILFYQANVKGRDGTPLPIM